MATHANIIIKVPTEYKGQSINFDANKLHCIIGHGVNIEGEWKEEPHSQGDRPTMDITKNYIYIDNHSDGYPASLGFILNKYYKEADSIINLASGGCIYGIYETYYEAWADHVNDPNWHISDVLWHHQQSDELSKQYPYSYLWENGVWYVKDYEYNNGESWVELEEVLKSLEQVGI